MSVTFAELAGRRSNRDASKAHVRIVANALCRLVGTGSQNDGATQVQGIAVVREGDYALESLAQVGAATHKRNVGGKPGSMLQ